MTMITNFGPHTIGMVRWNGNIHSFESMDQHGGWQIIQQSIQFPHDYHNMISWVNEQKTRQERLSALRKKYSSLDDALKNLEIITALVEEEESNKYAPSMIP